MKKILQVLALIVFIFYCLNANLYEKGTKSSKLTYIFNDGNRFRVYKSDSTLFSGLEIKDFGIKPEKIELYTAGTVLNKPEIPKNQIPLRDPQGNPQWECNMCVNKPGNVGIVMRYEIPYKKGLINGKIKVYKSDGKLYRTTNFINGNADGIQSNYWGTLPRRDEKFVNGYQVMFDENNIYDCYDKKNKKTPCYRK